MDGGEQAEVADLDEAAGEMVLEEAADEFDGRQGRGLAVARFEDDGAVVDAEQAAIADGDAVGVAAEVLVDLLGAAEGALGVDDPALLVEAGAAAAGRAVALRIMERAAGAQAFEAGEEFAAERLRPTPLIRPMAQIQFSSRCMVSNPARRLLIYLQQMNIAHTAHGDIEYRVTGEGKRVALILYGGHTDANTRLGEAYFLERGYRILAVSRPGYGHTPLGTGPTSAAFSDALAELLEQLGAAKALVVGISAGGRTAVRFAANHPHRADKLILQSSISFAPWPARLLRLASHVAFHPSIEEYTWRFMRLLLKRSPRAAIKMMIRYMTTIDPSKVVAGFNRQQIKELADLFASMRSGEGFLNDIKTAGGDATAVTVPTLIIHSKYDKGVTLEHPRLLARQIEGSELYLSEAESHLIWFSPHYEAIKETMDRFLKERTDA